MFDFFGHSVFLKDIDDSNEKKKIFASMVFGRNSSPHIVHSSLIGKVQVVKDLTIRTQTKIEFLKFCQTDFNSKAKKNWQNCHLSK